MKKILLSFALIVGLLASASTAMAQGTATIILEAHDVWADGSGYQMLLDADHTAYGTTFQATGSLTGDCNVPSNLYDAFEYKIPAAADPSCTPSNMVVDGEVSITIPAGTYDYCITNPTADEKIWIAGDGGPGQSRADDFVFEAGKTYRFLVKRFGIGDGVELTIIDSEPNMSSYITLTVKSGKVIKLDFKAAADGTPVRIVSGSNTQDITVGTVWEGTTYYTADGTEMKVYGDIIGFDCQGNGANLTAIDVSHNTLLEVLLCQGNRLSILDVSKNTQLTELYCYRNQLSSLDISKNTQLGWLYCYGNNFSTAALDDIYCSLPDRIGTTNGKIQPVYSDTSSNHATVLATNKQNAIAKNWKVQYKNYTDIPATTGTYVCGTPHLDTYITLTVKSGEAIRLDFEAAADGTPVRIESGSNTQDITVGTDWKGATYYTADGTKMKIYGNIIGFDCNDNEDNITALDVSHNTQLTKLYCNKNNLSILDVSKNTQLTWLYCNKNNLSHLDISKNTALTVLSLWGNKFSTATLDAIYCRIPDMTGQPRKGYILPIHETSSATEQNNVNATNAKNATDKNWRVVIYKNDDTIDDITTTGTYDCSTYVVEATAEQALTLYPNPVADVLYLSATARTIRIYDMYGTEVAHATDTDRIDVAHLPAGIYTVKADGTVAKMVKR